MTLAVPVIVAVVIIAPTPRLPLARATVVIIPPTPSMPAVRAMIVVVVAREPPTLGLLMLLALLIVTASHVRVTAAVALTPRAAIGAGAILGDAREQRRRDQGDK